MAGAIAAVKEKLRKYPDLSVEAGEGSIRILPRDDQGFAVEIRELGGTVSVYFEGWHESFERQEEALNCFAMGLSDSARLKVLSRGGIDYNWTLETRQGTEWVPDSTTGLLLFPFWREKVTRYLQNRIP